VDLSRAVPHECAPDRVLDFQFFALREEIAGFEGRFRDYLRSPHGRFEAWLAARHVRRGR
jgi:hypothetical protein